MFRVGLLVPASNLTIEYEFNKFLKLFAVEERIIFHVNRLDFSTRYSVSQTDYYCEMLDYAETAIRQFKNICDVYVFCCTSAELFGRENPNILSTSAAKFLENQDTVIFPLASLKKSLLNYEVANITVFSPYADVQTNSLLNYLDLVSYDGVNILEQRSLGLKNSKDFFDFGVNILPDLIYNCPIKDHLSLVFCTNVPIIFSMLKCQQSIILSSNLALFYNCFSKIYNCNIMEVKKVFEEHAMNGFTAI